VDLPTYTNIWRIEKRLYKLYDFRLPAPLPITWIAVFAGITAPYIFFLVAIGLPFNHNLVWLYVLPPGVLTWLTTRPVIENKRLPELVSSQLRYLSEPRTWCRMAPFAEKDDVFVSVRVWHRHPSGARPRKARKAASRARPAGRLLEAATAPQPSASQAAEPAVSQPSAPAALPLPAWSPSAAPAAPLPVPQRATARPETKRARAPRARQRGSGPDERPQASAGEPRPGVAQRPARAVPPPKRRQDSRALEVSHDPEPDLRDLAGPGRASFAPPSWPQAVAGAFPQVAPFPEADPFPEVGAFPEVGPFPEDEALPEPGAVAQPEATPVPDAGPLPDAGPVPAAAPVSEADPVPAVGAFPLVEPFPENEALPEPEGVPEPEATPVPEAGRAPEAAPVPEAGPFRETAPVPEPSPFPEAGPFPELGAFPEVAPVPEAGPVAEPGAVAELEPLPDPGLAPAARPGLWSRRRRASQPAPASPAPASPAPASSAASPAPASPGRSVAARVANLFVDLDRDRPVPSVERALSGPGSLDDASWRRQVKVVAGGQGPGQRDREALDRERTRMPLPGPRRIAVLGCTSGAGQSVIALMTGHTLAAARAIPVAVLDLNPGATSLAAQIEPATSVTALLAGQGPDQQPSPAQAPERVREQARARTGRGRSRGQLDIIASDTRALGPEDYQRLAGLLADRYPLTLIDPAPSGLTRVLPLADQLVLVIPASPEAASALAHTQQWLSAHGYDELAARAVTVVNGVSRQNMEDVSQAESVARGRCRAIVRVPWDDLLPEMSRAGAESPAALRPQTRLACTALAGVLVASLGSGTAGLRTPVRGRSPGGHAG
jgi:MinD-like ATPase involved in chromosome partitioning or flagellar assembly